MFAFKPMIIGSPVTISSDVMEPTRFNFMLRVQLLQGYHALPFYMLRRIPGIKFTLMEKNIQ